MGIAVGMASVAGVRAFLPLTLIALWLQLLVGDVPGWTVVCVLGALAVAEIALDKMTTIERTLNRLMISVRMVAGALLVALIGSDGEAVLRDIFGEASVDLAAALSVLAPWLIVGAIVAGTVAILKVVLRPRSASGGAGVSNTFLSVFEDVVAVVGSIVGLFVPLLPILFVAFLLFFFNRVRRRRGRKYEGLRILRD